MPLATPYLSETVGPVLARAVAATVAAQPADPVEFLAEYLLRSVQAEQQQQEYQRDKQQRYDQELRRAAQEEVQQQEQDAAIAARQKAVAGLSCMVADPADLWAAAVQLVKTYTSVSAAYIATIADEEQPDWAPADGSAGDADPETEDEAAPDVVDQGGGDDEAAEQEGGDDEEEGADGGGEGGSSSSNGSSIAPPSYSAKLLRYVAASAGQEFLTALELRRPQQARDGEGSEGGQQQAEEPVPVTFRILDEHMPLLQVPAAATEPRIKFLRGVPRVGGYAAVAVPAGPSGPPSGAYHAILAADSLLPDGNGQALTREEVSLLWDVAQALGKALDGAAATRRSDAARGGAAEVVSGLAAALKAVRQAAPPPAEVPEVGEEPPAAGEGGEDGGEQPSPADAIAAAEAQLQHWGAAAAAARVGVSNASAALAVEQGALAAVVKAITSVRGVALKALRLAPTSPPATFAVLRATLLLLGAGPADVATWREASRQLNVGLFERLAGYDAAQARDAALWARVRAAYKAVRSPKDLERELPQSGLGALLLAWIKQVRAVARKAAVLREAEAVLAAVEARRVAGEASLAAAEATALEAAAAEAEGSEKEEGGDAEEEGGAEAKEEE